MDDLISRQGTIDLVRDICNAIMRECESLYDDEVGEEVYEDVREVDAILKCNKRIRKALRNMPSEQTERRLWFRIGEICVDESKGFISSGRAVEKIRELLREAEPYREEEE